MPKDPREVLRRWRSNGDILEDEAAAFYVLEMQPVSTPGGERVPPARFLLGAMPADARLETLEEASSTDFSPLAPLPALVADDQHVLKTLLADAVAQAPAQFEGRVSGQLLRLYRIAEGPLRKRLEGAVEELPIRLLGQPPPGLDALIALAPLADSGLTICPLHRGVRGLPTFREETFLTLAMGYARVHDLEEPLLTASGRNQAMQQLALLASGFHAVLWIMPGGRGKILRFRQGLGLAQMKAAPKNPTLRSLDLALLNALVLRSVLGIQNPEAPDHEQVLPVFSLEELVTEVDTGRFQTGFALNPPPAWEMRAVIEAAQKLPMKTLRIEPVPPSGLLFLSPGDGA